MPSPFKNINLEQFAALLDRFPFTRKINAIHMHHTWKPNHAQYKGHETIVGMWRYHTETKGWRDIAQHITIAPNGDIWLGRNWNLAPASAGGHNGNSIAGPFMFEMIGNFDQGCDTFWGEQRKTTLEVIARVQRKFHLAPESLVFHNAMSTKTCPGNAISYADIIEEVKNLQASLSESQVASRGISDGPFGIDALEINDAVDEALELLTRPTPPGKDSADAELSHDESETSFNPRQARGEEKDLGLTPEMLEDLRPHLVNLNMGQLSLEGEWKTSHADVDAIFEEHLPKALEEAKQKKLRIVFFAHGGLVKESSGLKIAHKHMAWWIKNDIYPIYFIWETGAFETIGQLIKRSRDGASRAISRDIFDHTTDLLIEETARALQGPRIWGGMKLSAQLASAIGQDLEKDEVGEGGARYVARKLSHFCASNKDKIELHAVGHSAGAIFHSYFIPTALDLKAPPFKSVHFLAPAVRVDTFKNKLAGRIGLGNGVDQLSIFTMSKSYEQDDNCASIYRKSLLYLIYHALEPERKTPILGLEQCLREDPELKKILGLGVANAPGGVIWSVSASDDGLSASTSTTHGGFDDDAATMNSVARRILGKADADHIVKFAKGERGVPSSDLWNNEVDWPEQIPSEVEFVPVTTVMQSTLSIPPTVPASFLSASFPPNSTTMGGGRRRALCVGINRYPTAPLYGCVADAQAWAGIFKRVGFEDPVMLLDERATRAAIVESLSSLVTSSRVGDVIVFQYSGHGTQLPDVSGDELNGDTPGEDEAICPYNFASGEFVIDDDIGEIFNRLPSGVNLTCFMDCCHSGTISRFAVGMTPGAGVTRPDERARFIAASDELKQAHRRFREKLGRRRTISSGGPSLMKEVVFSACLSSEVAWESGGHGEFTVRALRILQSISDGMTNERFEQLVTAEFGSTPRQHARLYCNPSAGTAQFLKPLGRL